MDILLEKIADVQVVSLSGRLDFSGATPLEEALQKLIDSGIKYILLDCADLRYVSSSGLGAFIKAAKLLKPEGGKVVFSALNHHVHAVFEMVGFSRLFEIFPTRQDALDSGTFGAA